MKNQNKELDTIDKMFLEYFENTNEIPSSTQETIDNSLKNINLSTISNISPIQKLKRVAIIIISIITLSSSIVFAKDIFNFLSSIFTNTTQSIDKAVENGYVQNVNMDFIYDNEIGLKIDYLIMDNTNLDINFVYNVDSNNISKIAISEYIIRNEKNNIIAFESDKEILYENVPEFNIIRTNSNENEKILKESILCTSLSNYEFPKSKSLIFEIKELSIIQESNTIKKSGNWIFEINLDDKFINQNKDNYITSYNPYIENIETTLSETALRIEINLNTPINEDWLLGVNSVKLKNNVDEEYKCNYQKTNDKYIYLEFDVGKFSNNINNLNLNLEIDENKYIDIILKK